MNIIKFYLSKPFKYEDLKIGMHVLVGFKNMCVINIFRANAICACCRHGGRCITISDGRAKYYACSLGLKTLDRRRIE